MNHENQKITSASSTGHTVPKRFIDFAPKTAMSMRLPQPRRIPTLSTSTPSFTHSTYNCFYSLYLFIHPQRAYCNVLIARLLLLEGSEFGFLPSEYTYKVLVEGLCKESDL
ncbi:pentatricopeptide repeat-containing protein [Quercus suber]|uniref:Pentatricopeptide repeat-containing protein n=1 Tax=Quercus suber TaxID=58331 RepID=A0AAW0JEK5_QUESU